MPQDNMMSQVLFLYLPIFAIFYFLVLRPQRQQQKKMQEMLKNLKKNDDVVTASGIHGTIVLVKDKTVVVRVDEGCRIEFDREAISQVKNPQGPVKPEVVK